MKPDDCLICFGTYSVDVTGELLYKNGAPAKLGPIPVRLLIALLQRHGEEVTFDELRAAGWPQVSFVETNTIYVHISNLRKAIGNGYILKGSLGYTFNADTPVDRRARRPTGEPVVSSVPSTPETGSGVSRSRRVPILATALVSIVIAGAWLIAYRLDKATAGSIAQSSVAGRGQPSRFTVDGRLLVVFDEHNRSLWDYVFPKMIAGGKVSETEGWAASKHKFVDLEGNGKISLLLGVGDLLYCFRSDGTLAWTRAPGRQTFTLQGQVLPAVYDISLVDSLEKPRRDGGRVVVGAHRGPGALYLVEVLTANGTKVAEYFHFGWFFALKIGSLGQSGHEDIFLAGVDDVTSNEGKYGATLVVLDPERVEGQASTMTGPGRALKDVPPAHEKAVLLFKEFARNPDPTRYCRGEDINVSKGSLELRIAQTGPGPAAWFRLNSHLRLESITPELYLQKALQATTLRDVPFDRWGEAVNHSLGDIRYIRNEFE